MDDKIEKEEWLVGAPTKDVENINDTLTTDSRPQIVVDSEQDNADFYPEGTNRLREDSMSDAIVKGSATPATRREADDDLNIKPSA